MAFNSNTSPGHDGAAASARRRHPARLTAGSQRGAFAIMFIPLLIVIFGFCGLAIDIGFLYNRKADLSGLSKAAALAAARELNGTPEGILAAKAKARETAERLKYFYFGSGLDVTWSDDALSFSASPSRPGSWTAASSFGPGSTADASNLYFAKVDSDGLDVAISTVQTVFIKILYSGLADIRIRDSAVAGRASLNVVPIGICAMSAARLEARPAVATNGTTLSELVQYGFRRGVSYDLMQLNPNGTVPARYGINPVAAPGTNSQPFSIAALKPFVCTGTMWMRGLTGGDLAVSPLPAAAPLADLASSLNARFDQYSESACLAGGSPTDANIKHYAYDLANGVRWMDPAIGRPAARSTTVREKLETVADLPDDHGTLPASPGDYGPLWSYARAVRAPSPLNAEPTIDYSPFDASSATWGTLYKAGPAPLSTYPSSSNTPYQATSTINGFYAAPTLGTGEVALRHRRVLHIPLLSCSAAAPSGSEAKASVLAVGRFFMTVPATADSLIAEFAGLASGQSISGQVRLYP